jgi:intein/homing endonuclease
MEGRVMSIDEARGMIPLHPNCFIDRQIPIYTSKGWCPIGDIKKGMLVLTHKSRFKKVIEVIRTEEKQPKMVTIFLELLDEKKIRVLPITCNHPVLIEGKWILAENIKVGMNVTYLADVYKEGEKDIHFKFCKVRVIKVDKWKSAKYETLYNFSVAGDESYIAKGFVVHNCRCIWVPGIKTTKNKKK